MRVAFAAWVQGNPVEYVKIQTITQSQMLPADMKHTRHADASHSTIVMVTYFSCNGK